MLQQQLYKKGQVMQTNNKVLNLITHSGNFHADDVTSFAILAHLYEYKSINLLRTRNDRKIQEALKNTNHNAIIFDIGGIYDPDRAIFDHHMPQSAQKKRRNGKTYSSVGLIWKHFGKQYVDYVTHKKQNPDIIDAIWKSIDDDFIQHIDLFDNGETQLIPQKTDYVWIIESFNQTEGSEKDQNKRFLAASQMARLTLENLIAHTLIYVTDDAKAQEIIDQRPDPRYLVLDENIEFEKTLLKENNKNILFVVFPTSEETWVLKTVRKSEKSFEAKKDLPKEWSGLNGEDFIKATGCPTAIFCHQKLFISAARSKRDILEMLGQALKY